ncbi:hypothetical protein AXYL_04051 [Achromobacter xylosoxidans A8]|uniref:Uncharacterized protein n=1 Tax=Achromobacter xylosoxidans (strain A8) TaxID=762376 RepID=E3HTT1_ACHXA|nr:hypothetical protein [Achromobacter xylosoxidans]ADP17371.1 hypothetical protein AXYL_04051 [Achromobacter xylosoxidans A8]
MNTISATAPPARAGVRSATVKVATQLAEFIAPSDHAGKGNWDSNKWPPPIAWIGAAVFAFIFLVVLPWLGRGAGF